MAMTDGVGLRTRFLMRMPPPTLIPMAAAPRLSVSEGRWLRSLAKKFRLVSSRSGVRLDDGELALLLPGTALRGGLECAERLRLVLAALAVASYPHLLTASVGAWGSLQRPVGALSAASARKRSTPWLPIAATPIHANTRPKRPRSTQPGSCALSSV